MHSRPQHGHLCRCSITNSNQARDANDIKRRGVREGGTYALAVNIKRVLSNIKPITALTTAITSVINNGRIGIASGSAYKWGLNKKFKTWNKPPEFLNNPPGHAPVAGEGTQRTACDTHELKFHEQLKILTLDFQILFK